ncbi:transcription factor HHO5 [Humulus lupulus]|uniref:transcription factor HHO5 n=1 Tax=Humulus lupulus TaxID=3486 RepID=UPI002B40E87C|nr:transcription factor HHO5 [Humulus lupulus]
MFFWNVGEREREVKIMELSLNSGLVFVPKTISDFLQQVSTIRDGSEKLSKLDDYVKRFEEERRKIDAFKRELPLCMSLVNDAIARLKEEEKAIKCSGSRDGHAMEEFISLKGNSDEDGSTNLADDSSDKKSWMSSAQLWSTNVVDCDSHKKNSVSELKPRIEEVVDLHVSEKPIGVSDYRNRGGAFVPFKGQASHCGVVRTSLKEDKESSLSRVPSLTLMPPTPISEVGGTSDSNPKSSHSCKAGSTSSFLTEQVKLVSKPQLVQQTQHQHQQQPFRKQRRCWSIELHRRFVDAIHQLGGSQVATPKQIRELMRVEGLTNDEVKSHLQKYRLHVRKVPNSSAEPDSGLWMSQDQCGDSSHQSASPQGPLAPSGSNKALSHTGGDSTEVEEEEDEKSDGHSWRGGNHNKAGEDV